MPGLEAVSWHAVCQPIFCRLSPQEMFSTPLTRFKEAADTQLRRLLSSAGVSTNSHTPSQQHARPMLEDDAGENMKCSELSVEGSELSYSS